jgi:CubicO group peptidase (beta-lactamase class C family)
VEELIAAVLRERHCPGAVVTVGGGGAFSTVAVGTTGTDTAQPVDAGMWFEIGSITKVLVATLVLQHVARGDITLDDPIEQHVPEFRLAGAAASSAVTIRHLLTHASGVDVADDFTDTGEGEDCVGRYVEEAVAGSGLVHPVGDRWSYCNGGYVLLGRLVEVLDGRPWDVALADRILEPCAMDATNRRLAPNDPRITPGHHVDPVSGAVQRVTKRMPASIGPAGNVVATAEALTRFADCLFGEGELLLPKPLVAEMVSPQIAMRDGNQGLGWALPDAPMPLAVHGGATIGYTAILGTVPSLQSSLAVVANGPGAAAIALAVQAHLSGAPMPEPQPASPQPDLDATAASLLTGRYARRHVLQDIELTDEGLMARTRFEGPCAELFPQPPLSRLEPLGGPDFASRHPFAPDPVRWEFGDLDAQGRPTRLFSNRVQVRVTSP